MSSPIIGGCLRPSNSTSRKLTSLFSQRATAYAGLLRNHFNASGKAFDRHTGFPTVTNPLVAKLHAIQLPGPGLLPLIREALSAPRAPTSALIEARLHAVSIIPRTNPGASRANRAPGRGQPGASRVHLAGLDPQGVDGPGAAVLSVGLALLMLVAIRARGGISEPARHPRDHRLPAQVAAAHLSADGVLLGEFGEERRNGVPIAETPKVMRDAVLAAEDARFYEHGGIDYKGRAARRHGNFSGLGSQVPRRSRCRWPELLPVHRRR